VTSCVKSGSRSYFLFAHSYFFVGVIFTKILETRLFAVLVNIKNLKYQCIEKSNNFSCVSDSGFTEQIVYIFGSLPAAMCEVNVP
jgi:hypothetical protein